MNQVIRQLNCPISISPRDLDPTPTSASGCSHNSIIKIIHSNKLEKLCLQNIECSDLHLDSIYRNMITKKIKR